jgi:hypothetical protein
LQISPTMNSFRTIKDIIGLCKQVMTGPEQISLLPFVNGYFSDERRSPRVSALDVLQVCLVAA